MLQMVVIGIKYFGYTECSVSRRPKMASNDRQDSNWYYKKNIKNVLNYNDLGMCVLCQFFDS